MTTLIMVVLFVLALAGALTQSTSGAYASGNVSITRTFNPPAADSYVDEYPTNADSNFGLNPSLGVQSYFSAPNHFNRRTFIQFDTSFLPTNSIINSAMLQLYLYRAPVSARTYGIHRVPSSWTETGLTWNNQPAPLPPATSTTNLGTSGGLWLSWDVTNDVRAWTQSQPATNFGWALKDTQEDAAYMFSGWFYSREYTSNRPRFSVTYSAPWESYQDIDCTTTRDDFTVVYSYVYMKGTGFPNSTYLVAYYDAGGVKRSSEMVTVTGGNINSQCVLNTDQTATPGVWHALVQPTSGYTGFGTNSYDAITAAPDTYGLLANDSFTVQSSAIPEFPTAAAGIGVSGLCFGIYWFTRRRRLSYVN